MSFKAGDLVTLNIPVPRLNMKAGTAASVEAADEKHVGISMIAKNGERLSMIVLPEWIHHRTAEESKADPSAPSVLKIVTHAGQAHSDELLAIALILIKNGIDARDKDRYSIERENDGQAADFSADFVVDIGGQYQPEKGWFDHHQFDSFALPACALTLVAAHYGLEQADFPWMRKLAVLDSKGPYVWFSTAFGRRAKNNKEVIEALNEKESIFSFLPRIANRAYEEEDSYHQALYLATKWLGMEIDYVQKKQENVAFAKSNMRIMQMPGFKVVFFEQREMRGTGEVSDDASEADPSIIVSAKLDDRGDGYSAMRLNDNRNVNFLPRAGEPGCVFAHKTGFCLKWEKNLDGFLDAIKRSVSANLQA